MKISMTTVMKDTIFVEDEGDGVMVTLECPRVYLNYADIALLLQILCKFPSSGAEPND